ncbi:MAG: MarR family transcriptional regulator [archaeon]
MTGLFLVFLLSGMAFASQIADHRIIVDIDDKYVAHFNVMMTFVELNTQEINYLVFAHIENPRATDVLGELVCRVDKQTYGTQISCIPNSQMKGNYTVEISFDAYDLVRMRGGAESFSYGYSIKDPTNKLSMKILLPAGAALLSADNFDPYFPEGARIGTELGRRVSLEWDVVKPELGRSYNFESNFEFVGKVPGDDSTAGDSPVSVNYLLLFVAGLGIIIMVLGIRWWTGRRKAGGVKTVFSVLKDDERKVIDVILEKGDKCKQRDIVRATDYSKAKVSRIMSELEARGILSRVRVGRTNRVILSDNMDRKPVKSKPD